MITRIIAIVLIYLCTAATWIFLGTTVDRRTEEYDKKSRGAVGELWGASQKQEAPKFTLAGSDGTGHTVLIPLQASDLTVNLRLDYRQKGLLWYSTYRVNFAGRYRVLNSTDTAQRALLTFKLPSDRAIYDNVKLLIGGQEVHDLPIRQGILFGALSLEPGQTQLVEVRYATTGMDEWWYDFGSSVNQVKNFSLTMSTDFDQIDFPENSISPTHLFISSP